MRKPSFADKAVRPPVTSGAVAILPALVLLAAGIMSCTATLTPAELAAEYVNIGNAYFELDRFEEAGSYYLRAVDLDPSLNRAGFNLARAYIEQGRPRDAIPLLENLLVEDPQNRTVLETLGFAAYLTGDAERAAEIYDRLVLLSVLDSRILYNAATIHARLGNSERAYDLFSLAAELAPEDPEVQRGLAEAAFAQDRFEAGVNALDAYRLLVAGDGLLLEEAGDLYREHRYFDRALATYDEALEAAGTGGEPAARLHFKRAWILLTAAGEAELGLAALASALDAGFSDVEAAMGLVSEEDLVDRAAVELLLRERGVFDPEDGGSGEDNDGPDASPPDAPEDPPDGTDAEPISDETGPS